MVRQLSQVQIDVFVDAIIDLEAFAVATDGSLLKRLLVPFFSHLSFYQQCRLLVDLQKNGSCRLKGLSTCLNTYKMMCLLSLRPGLSSTGGVPVGEVVSSYIKLNDKRILKIFVDHILWRKDNTGKEFNNSAWLEEVITWTKSSVLAINTVVDIVEQRVAVMKISLVEPPSREEDIRRAECVRFFLVLLRLEQSPQLADSKRLDPFTSLFQIMAPNRLLNLVVDLLKQGHARMKKHPSGILLFTRLGFSLLERDCSVFQGGPPIPAIVEILKCLIGLQDKLFTAHKFVINICCSDKWSPYSKNELIGRIFSSLEIWTIGKEGAKDIYHKCVTLLLKKWIAGIHSIMNQPTGNGPEAEEEKTSYLRKNFQSFFLIYIQQHKTDNSSIINDPLSPLLEKLPIQELGQLMWTVYQSDIKELPSLKKFSATLKLYVDLCRKFVIKEDLIHWIKSASNMLIETTSCLLWLGDKQSFLLFTNKMLVTYPSNKPNAVITRIAKSTEIRQLIEKFPHSREPFCRFLKQRASIIREELEREAELVWKMPSTNLPGHPVVQNFLRSSVQQMTYANFGKTEEAQQFATLLSSLSPDNGYALHVDITGEQFDTTCKIVKVKVDCRFTKGLLLDEKMVLESALDSLKYQSGDSANSASGSANADKDEVVIVAAKKVKLDLPVIDLSD